MAKNPFVLRLRDSKRAEAIAELLQEGKPEFTTVVSTKDDPVGRFEIAFIGLAPGRVDYLARIASGSKPATFQRRIAVTDFVRLDMAVKEWVALLPAKKQARLSGLLIHGGRFTDALWRDARAALVKAHPDIDDALKRHQKKSHAAEHSADPNKVESTLFEREAVAFAIETWGGSRARKEALLGSEPITERAPFLNNLGKVSLRENVAIEHDSTTIPGYELLRKHLVGVAEFVGPDSKLTVLNANLKPLEEVLGVDLIYYNHVFRSFVLIQYKRMGSMVNHRPCYRPDTDKHFQPECERIDGWVKAFKSLLPQPVGHRDFRLGGGAFFFKFCDLKNAMAFDTSLSPGFYLPYPLLQRLLRSKISKGPRGGRLIGWHTGRRVLSNKRMMELIQAGWIGSSGATTAKLEEVLRGVLTGNRSLIYAVSAPLREPRQVHRDVLGMYAAEDDPLAHPEIQ